MLDLLVSNGLLVDGTGAPPKRADVAVRNGRVAEVAEPGAIDEPAGRVIDATDLAVCPGFVDIHTHYDAQAFWDPTLSPSPLHGVTTVVGGNCGFSIAPLCGNADDADYLMRMLARVEGMPLESLQQGVPWDWTSTADFFEHLDSTLSPNAAFMVGHSALRRAVMHEAAAGSEATPEQLDEMKSLLRKGLAAGAIGFSSTWSRTHNDHNGDPVPSRHATPDELVELCSVVGEFPGTTLEFIPAPPPFDDSNFELMAAMSRAANRPINWNVLAVYSRNSEVVSRQLAGSDLARRLGGRVVALTLPDSQRNRLNFKSGFILDILPGWDKLMALPDTDKLAMLADPVARLRMDEAAQSQVGPLRSIANWGQYLIVETADPAGRAFVGRTVADLASHLGKTPWDALVDMVVSDELKTVIVNQDRGQDVASWERRVEVWRDQRTVVGASDAGAHLDMIDTFNYTTTVLAKAVREHRLLSLEEAVSHLTSGPADLYGLVGRGLVAPGGWADLVVFDPETVGPSPVSTRYDLPGGAGRVYGGSTGIHEVVVAGEVVVQGAEFTDARPGRILRSGLDTRTVTARPATGSNTTAGA